MAEHIIAQRLHLSVGDVTRQQILEGLLVQGPALAETSQPNALRRLHFWKRFGSGLASSTPKIGERVAWMIIWRLLKVVLHASALTLPSCASARVPLQEV